MSNDTKSEQLAIIRNVNCGVGDYGKACLWFDAYIGECAAALQVIEWGAAGKLLEEAGIADVNKLNGRPCYVEVGGGMILFKRMAKI